MWPFDAFKRIEGQLIRTVGVRPPGRAEEFLPWTRQNEPEELEYLMSGGEIDPGGDRPKRMRELLNQWRNPEGLSTIP